MYITAQVENRLYNNVGMTLRLYQVNNLDLTHLWEDGQVPYRTLLLLPKHTV